jgi:hypothetical protein
MLLKRTLDEEKERLLALAAVLEGKLRRAVEAFVVSATSETVVAHVTELVLAQRLEEATAVVDSYVATLGSTLPTLFAQGASAETANLAARVPGGTISLSFDPAHPRAAELMRQQRLEFVVDFTRAQREVTRQALTDALYSGEGPRAVARAFRGTVGLTSRQRRAVLNYERLLRTGSAEALDRGLRDRRFDPTVRRATTGGDPLTDEQVTRMVDRYRARMVKLRAETIARTETARVLNEARQEATTQVLEQLETTQDVVERTWRSVRDGRTRDTHRGLDGQRVRGLQTPFVSSSGARLRYPGDPAAPGEEVINCRCVVTQRILHVEVT